MDVWDGTVRGGLTLEPWMIEKLREEERRKKPSTIPLYLPLVESPLTGSSDKVKKRENGTAIVDYTL